MRGDRNLLVEVASVVEGVLVPRETEDLRLKFSKKREDEEGQREVLRGKDQERDATANETHNVPHLPAFLSKGRVLGDKR